ncbi:helix-turn-helix domain-containing protein [Williamsia sp. DF01-3]|uniref:helix-turn-helix domain-containing protein n=1 Tax=Williamsia sp. DF01-3 TaxID=2934157 RepID=UPI001FF38C22|nr:helix-turn-helix domain-containing protein [Williamsia sp. DF01-3]MCK0517317.1 helix-turn-helix domain-containing protein [Williamsia sp. DF01-3]
MSWKAVDWATDAHLGSPVLKLILILLANKADEQFSCFPSVRTLMAESGAGRSTVLRALQRLEAEGYVTRRAQFHQSGAQRSSRYFLNHPDAPHVDSDPSPELTLPRPESGRPPSRRHTGRVSERHPPGDPKRDPLNPSTETPSEPSTLDDAERVFDALPAPWTVGRADRRHLSPAVFSALAAGWTVDELAKHLARNPNGVRYPVRVLVTRLADLPAPPGGLAPNGTALLPWCGECEDERSRTITVTRTDGSDAAAFCPRCSHQAARNPTGSSDQFTSPAAREAGA